MDQGKHLNEVADSIKAELIHHMTEANKASFSFQRQLLQQARGREIKEDVNIAASILQHYKLWAQERNSMRSTRRN